MNRNLQGEYSIGATPIEVGWLYFKRYAGELLVKYGYDTRDNL